MQVAQNETWFKATVLKEEWPREVVGALESVATVRREYATVPGETWRQEHSVLRLHGSSACGSAASMGRQLVQVGQVSPAHELDPRPEVVIAQPKVASSRARMARRSVEGLCVMSAFLVG
jgi:hypothetical protein